VGSTDVHNSLSFVEEDNFFGKLPIQEPSPTRWEHVSKQSSWAPTVAPARTRYTLAVHVSRLRGGVGDGEHARGDLGRR
jgi:hypothetical protein